MERHQSEPSAESARAALRPPWVLAHLWSSGPDTSQDRLLRLLAMREDGSGGWERFDHEFTLEEHARADSRPASDSGWPATQSAGTSNASALWTAWREFLGAGPVLTLEQTNFRGWCEHIAGSTNCLPPTIGLCDLAALMIPGRLANQGEQLLQLLLDRRGLPVGAVFPNEIAAGLCELISRFCALPDSARTLVGWSLGRARAAFVAHDARAAEQLDLIVEALRSPTFWQQAASGSAITPAPATQVWPTVFDEADLEFLLDELEPRWSALLQDWLRWDPLEASLESLNPWPAEEEALLERIFREHLPRLFACPEHSSQTPPYRQSQHAVARAVAIALSAPGLLLVHAPTGTGKTLAYLLPALLWARRNAVRVGVATYTRALQEQAMEREVPQALRALVAAGELPGWRVSLLKGRENYLCWRAFLLAGPSNDDSAEAWLAWCVLLLFALNDAEGDLDRLPRRAPLLVQEDARYRRALESILRNVRAQSVCCTRNEDRQSCGAEVARRRAERSHVVITNHAFALHRTEFFRHIIFDECEHLHDQAMSAWSHKLSLRSVKNFLAGLHRPRKDQSRAVLDRLRRLLIDGGPAMERVERALSAWQTCADAIDQLQAATVSFEAWRTRLEQERSERERHALLREYAEMESGQELLATRQAASLAANALDAQLAEIVERLEAMPLRGRASLRRALDLARTELAEWVSALESWLPVSEGLPQLRRETFYDVEFDSQGEAVLHARVLLPNEYLARNYYPQLTNAVFLSATTWLRESFDGALGYLGLDRAGAGDEQLQRPARAVECFRAPEVFDYSRVLVAVPRDAPPASDDKSRYLQYVRSFLAALGERTRGRILALFTNQQDVLAVGQDLTGFFRARRIPLWYQGMEGVGKEELSDLFRRRVDSILLGVDTFWYGADFPGETLEYLVIVRLPYGVPDRYHQAQCAALGQAEQRRRIYLPRALSKFRQGFGRLMRKESDRGAVFILDQRILDPRHRLFLAELPLQTAWAAQAADLDVRRSHLVRAPTEECLRAAYEHMGLIPAPAQDGSRPASAQAAALLNLPTEELPF